MTSKIAALARGLFRMIILMLIVKGYYILIGGEFPSLLAFPIGVLAGLTELDWCWGRQP